MSKDIYGQEWGAMTATSGTVSFDVRTEVTPAYFSDLLTFLYQNYVFPLSKHFTNIGRWDTDGRQMLAFTFTEPEGRWHVDIEMEAGNIIQVRMRPSEPMVPGSVLNRLKEDLIVNVQIFEEKMRRTTLYFAFAKSEEIMLERALGKRKKALSQIFFGNMLVLFMIFIFISYLTYVGLSILGLELYTPLFLILSQVIVVLFADRIMMRMGDWPITSDNPDVHILQYHIPPEEFPAFSQRYNRGLLLQIKREIYERTLTIGKPIDFETVREVFSKYGVTCRPENLSTKTVNVYRLVEEAAEKFNIAVPKITIANIIIPNAGATGPSPSRGLVLITSGLLVQLEEDEIFSIVGHEISHLKRRDPLALFALTSAEYLFRVYFLLRYIFFFGFLYFFLALSGIYFVAKFFEARADLESAMTIGHPEVLAGALRKIGFRRIQMERLRYSRIGNWLGMDPHPPVSFRVARLENIGDPSKIKHPFMRSMIDCINGLLKS